MPEGPGTGWQPCNSLAACDAHLLFIHLMHAAVALKKTVRKEGHKKATNVDKTNTNSARIETISVQFGFGLELGLDWVWVWSWGWTGFGFGVGVGLGLELGLALRLGFEVRAWIVDLVRLRIVPIYLIVNYDKMVIWVSF